MCICTGYPALIDDVSNKNWAISLYLIDGQPNVGIKRKSDNMDSCDDYRSIGCQTDLGLPGVRLLTGECFLAICPVEKRS